MSVYHTYILLQREPIAIIADCALNDLRWYTEFEVTRYDMAFSVHLFQKKILFLLVVWNFLNYVCLFYLYHFLFNSLNIPEQLQKCILCAYVKQFEQRVFFCFKSTSRREPRSRKLSHLLSGLLKWSVNATVWLLLWMSAERQKKKKKDRQEDKVALQSTFYLGM